MKISIAMATYNGDKFLAEQIDSIQNQTITDFELIICDDCSTDSTQEILDSYTIRDPRIHVYKNELNLGFKKNFEKALTLCTGEFIALCDQDDIWLPNHLEVLLNNIGKNDCIGANALFIDENGKSMQKTMKSFIPIHHPPQNATDVFLHEVYDNIIQGAASLIRRELLAKALPFPNNVKYHDYWLAIIACLNKGCLYTDTIVLKYRRHNNNVSTAKKFTLSQAYTLLKETAHQKKEIYQNHISILKNALGLNYITNQQKLALKKAELFYSNLLCEKNKFSNFLFFLVNYHQITLSKKRKIPFFFYKTFAFLRFGIK